MTAAADAAAHAAAGIVESHRNELRRFVAALVGAEHAADVVQESWLRLSRVMAETEVEHPKALLFRIASNLACDELRRRQRQRRLLDSSKPLTEHQAPSASEHAVLDEQLSQVKRAIDSLPDKCRRVFMLKRVEGHSYREIAAREGITEKTVENQISRALKLIRKRMGEGQ